MHKMIFPAVLVLSLFIGNCAYALKPVKEYSVVPDTLHVPYEKNEIVTADNVHLKSWTFLPHGQDKKVTLVMAYADAGNMSWWVERARSFSGKGYTVLLFDYRGFGESSAFAIDQKMLYYDEFARDLEAAVKFARGKYAKNKTGVLCYSMGTIIATLAAEKADPDFIIGEGYVTDPVMIQANSAKKGKHVLLPADAAGYKAKLEKINTRMLIFSGKADMITTDAAVMELKKMKPAINVVGFNGDHLQGFDVMSKTSHGSEYLKAVDQFLK